MRPKVIPLDVYLFARRTRPDVFRQLQVAIRKGHAVIGARRRQLALSKAAR